MEALSAKFNEFEKAVARRDELQEKYEKHLSAIAGFSPASHLLDVDQLRAVCSGILAEDDYIAHLNQIEEVVYAPV